MIIILVLFLALGIALWFAPVPPKLSELGRLIVLATLIALVPVLAGEVRVR